MTIVGFLGILLSLAAIPFASANQTLGRLLTVLALLIIHLCAAGAYYFYAQSNTADTAFYYLDPLKFDRFPWTDLSTVFVVHVTQLLKKGFGATYLDCFLFFQAFGFWGIMLLMRTFQEIHKNTRTPESALSIYLLFLPSVHFWTSSIGKDGPLFFAISLAMWSALNLSKRIPYLCLALLVMVLFRVHIALVAVVSLAVAAILHGHFSAGRKALLLIITLTGVGVLVLAVQNTLAVNVADLKSLASFFEVQTDVATSDRASTSIGATSFPVQAISLLFRPFFFDANSILAYGASLENLLSVALVLFLSMHWRNIVALTRQVFFIRYALTFSIIVFVMLAAVYYNVGTGLRQRVMLYPPLFSILVAVWAMRRFRIPPAPRPSVSYSSGLRKPA